MYFDYIYRGFKKALVVLPGWGFDYRIFPLDPLEYNLIVPAAPLYQDICQDLASFLENNKLCEVDILGWSLGGVSAYLFAKRYEELIKNLVLISSRDSYPKEQLSVLMEQIVEDKERTLKKFYLSSFYAQTADYRIFRRDHMQRLMDAWSKESLIKGLNFLLQFPMTPYSFTKLNLLIVHGEYDKIAPVSSMAPVISDRKFKRLIVDSSGHLPFLRINFNEVLDSF